MAVLEKDIIKVLSPSGKMMTTRQIAKSVNCGKALVSGYLKSMADRGVIRMQKVGRANIYWIG